jgi:hypothetical protein
VPGSTGQLDVDWSDDRVQFTVTNTQPDAAREQEAAWAQVTAYRVTATLPVLSTTTTGSPRSSVVEHGRKQSGPDYFRQRP